MKGIDLAKAFYEELENMINMSMSQGGSHVH